MSTITRSRLRKIGVMSLVSGVITLGLSMTTGTPAVADVTAVQGDATALSIGGTPVVPQVTGSATFPQTGYGPIGTGDLPSGVDCATGVVPTLPVTVSALLSVGLLEACTRGGNVGTHQGFAESQARVIDLTLAGTDLGVITSTCRADGDGAVGNTTIVGSSVLPENPTPGQTVPVPLVSPLLPALLELTLNEQIVTNVEGRAEITVNAVRLTLLGIDIIVGQVHCLATGPDVNVTPTTPTTAPDGTTTTTTTTTTAPPGDGVTTPPINNTNNNTNNNSNTSNNTNNNTTTNQNSNTNTNNQNQTQTNDQTQTNSQTQTGGDNTNANSNVITITNLGSNFDDFHHRGKFRNDDHDGKGGHDGKDDGKDGGKHFGKALARTGSESSRLTGVALLLLVIGSALVLGTRTMTAEAAAVPGTRADRRRARFSPSRRWR